MGSGDESAGRGRAPEAVDPELLARLLDVLGDGGSRPTSGDDGRELLARLVERAQEAIAEQARLRRLVRAHRLLIGDVDLRATLQRVVRAAAVCTGASYSALGVLGADGGLADFVFTGVPAQVADAIGHRPRGEGLLGELVRDPRPLRVADIAGDPRAHGLPPGHPPMHSFLGVPVRVDRQVFGNLYLAEAPDGRFTAADEAVLVSLAAAAGSVIAIARRHTVAVEHQRWLEASAALTRSIRAGKSAELVEVLVGRARELAAADTATMWMLDEPRGPAPSGSGTLAVAASAGAPAATVGTTPVAGTDLGDVLTRERPRRTDGPAAQQLLLPLHGAQAGIGVLVLARGPDRPAFTDDDLDMAAEFAQHAAVALELAQGDTADSVLAEERDRIATELHERVIHQLYGAGLALHTAAAMAGPGPVTAIITSTIDALDDIIGHIRSTVYGLRQLRAPTEEELHQRLVAAAQDVTGACSTPTVELVGASTVVVPSELADDVADALSTILGHLADPADARIRLDAAGHELALEVQDSTTREFPAAAAADLDEAARRHGGSFRAEPGAPGGVRLRWTSPNS